MPEGVVDGLQAVHVRRDVGEIRVQRGAHQRGLLLLEGAAVQKLGGLIPEGGVGQRPRAGDDDAYGDHQYDHHQRAEHHVEQYHVDELPRLAAPVAGDHQVPAQIVDVLGHRVAAPAQRLEAVVVGLAQGDALHAGGLHAGLVRVHHHQAVGVHEVDLHAVVPLQAGEQLLGAGEAYAHAAHAQQLAGVVLDAGVHEHRPGVLAELVRVDVQLVGVAPGHEVGVPAVAPAGLGIDDLACAAGGVVAPAGGRHQEGGLAVQALPYAREVAGHQPGVLRVIVALLVLQHLDDEGIVGHRPGDRDRLGQLPADGVVDPGGQRLAQLLQVLPGHDAQRPQGDECGQQKAEYDDGKGKFGDDSPVHDLSASSMVSGGTSFPVPIIAKTPATFNRNGKKGSYCERTGNNHRRHAKRQWTAPGNSGIIIFRKVK